MFTEHGSFQVELRGNVLFLKIEGAWNIETCLAYQKAISKEIAPVVGKNWAVITFMSDWELCTPDSEPVLVDIVKSAVSKGMIREAVVNTKGMIKLELFEKYRNVKLDCPNDIPFKRHIYQDESAALEWLANEGFIPSRVM